jgi:hypothetical protein
MLQDGPSAVSRSRPALVMAQWPIETFSAKPSFARFESAHELRKSHTGLPAGMRRRSPGRSCSPMRASRRFLISPFSVTPEAMISSSGIS